VTPSEAPQAAPAATVVDVERLGGEAGIARWVQRFYEKVAREPVLAPMFEDLERAQAKQIAYFVELFGGPKRYSEQYGPPFLRFKHRAFRIGQPERDAWMLLAMEALRECGADEAVLAEVERKLSAIADAMVNHHPQRHDPYYFQR
jgi:hemoglobin